MRRIVQIIFILFIAIGVSSCFKFQPPRCKVPGCHVRLVHPHGGKEYRGTPWWTPNQNPKIGQDYELGKRPKY